MRAIGRIVGGLVVAGGVATFGATGGFEDKTERNEAGEITEAGGVGVFVMEVGDCVELPESDYVESLEGVPCDTPHDAQLYAEFDLDNTSLPGPTELQQLATDGCIFAWPAMLGANYDEMPNHDIYFFTPTSETWSNGDREVQCLVITVDGSPITGSILTQ
ncbi:MAG: septum formation family protein [Actinomycetota bacterium]